MPLHAEQGQAVMARGRLIAGAEPRADADHGASLVVGPRTRPVFQDHVDIERQAQEGGQGLSLIVAQEHPALGQVPA